MVFNTKWSKWSSMTWMIWGYPWVSPVSFGDYDKKAVGSEPSICVNRFDRESDRAVGVCPKNELNKLSYVSLLYIWFVHIRSICSRCLTMLAYLQNVWLLCVNNLWMSTHPDSTTVNIYIYIYHDVTTLLPSCNHQDSEDDMFPFYSIEWLLYVSWLVSNFQFTILMSICSPIENVNQTKKCPEYINIDHIITLRCPTSVTNLSSFESKLSMLLC